MTGRGDLDKVSRHGWTALALLCVANLFNYMDRMLLAATAQPVKQEFGLSDTQLGLLTGMAFAFFYAVVGLPMGRLADRVSRKRLLAGCLALWSLVTAATGFAQNFAQLALARVTIAIGEAGVSPSATSMIGDYFPRRRRNFASGLFVGGSMIGIIAGFSLGGWISQEYGWRAAFWVLGAPGLLLALVFLLVVREPKRGAMDDVLLDPLSNREAVRAIWENRAFKILAFACGVNAMVVFGVSQWTPLFLIRNHGLSLAQVGVLFGIGYGLGMFFGQLLGGLLGDRLTRRSFSAPLFGSAVVSLIATPIFVGAMWVESYEAAVALIFVSALILAMANPPSNAAVHIVLPPNMRGTGAATVSLHVALIGIGLGPTLVGFASDALAPSFGDDSLRMALTLLQAVNLLAAALYAATALAIRARFDRPAQPAIA